MGTSPTPPSKWLGFYERKGMNMAEALIFIGLMVAFFMVLCVLDSIFQVFYRKSRRFRKWFNAYTKDFGRYDYIERSYDRRRG